MLRVFHEQTLHGEGTETDPLGVTLSESAGNLLEIRDDGLYYGTSADDETLNLYVDAVNGSDDNIGSREKPLNTLNRALELTPENKSNTIHLKSGQTFILDRDANIVGCTRIIQPYDDPWMDGDKVPEITSANPAYFPWCAKALARPVIKAHLSYNSANHRYTHNQLYLTTGATLKMFGLIIDAVPDNDRQETGDWLPFNFGPIYGDSGCTIMFGGCYLITSPDNPPADYDYPSVVVASLSQGGMPSLLFCRCNILSGYSVVEMQSCPSGSIACQDDWPTEYEIDYVEGNTASAFKEGAITGILRGPNNEPRNLMINIVI